MESVFAYILTTDKGIITKLLRNIKQEKHGTMDYIGDPYSYANFS